MRYLSVLIFTIIFSNSVFSQELQCNIQINSSQITGTNKLVFQAMQRDIYEFMNTRNWTNHVFATEERIECNIMITISRQTTSLFEGELLVQIRRPVFNSSYTTVLLNHLDQNFEFEYVEFEKLEFNENAYTSELTSVLAYYAYIILGYDYDTYSPMGGNPYFEKALNVLNIAQNANRTGWKAYESNQKNRYWLITNIMDKNYEQLRMVYYNFHRQGLDVMYEKINEGRTQITESLYELQKLYRKKPDQSMVYYNLFFTAKADEIVNIYSEAFPDEKARVYTLLNEIDNQNSAKYQKLRTTQ